MRILETNDSSSKIGVEMFLFIWKSNWRLSFSVEEHVCPPQLCSLSNLEWWALISIVWAHSPVFSWHVFLMAFFYLQALLYTIANEALCFKRMTTQRLPNVKRECGNRDLGWEWSRRLEPIWCSHPTNWTLQHASNITWCSWLLNLIVHIDLLVDLMVAVNYYGHQEWPRKS